jgi:nucleoside-diphosphate-sugar epimerase
VTGSWTGRRVLVTGAGGFIGSHVVERLQQQGASVRAFLRHTGARSVGALAELDDLSGVELVFGDLRNPDSVEGAVSGCDVVLHLGAEVSVPFSFEAPRDAVETNALGTLNVLSAVRRDPVERVVVMSTSEVYGTAQTVPITEDHALGAQSPYAASKVASDMIARSFHLAFGLPVGVLRPFNTYGPRQSGRAVISTLISQALAGGVVRLGALDPVRDYTYVTDTVAGLLGFAAWEGSVGTVIQLGTGTAVSVRELVQVIEELLGRRLEIELDESRLRPANSEVHKLISDPSRALREFAWRPEVTLTEGIARTVQWHRERAPQALPIG